MRKVVSLDISLQKTTVCVLRELLDQRPKLEVAIGPLLCVLEQLVGERGKMDKLLGQVARTDKLCLRLMTIPGVGPITFVLSRSSKPTMPDGCQ